MTKTEIPFNRILMVDDSDLDFYIVTETIKRHKPSVSMFYAMDVDSALQMLKNFPASEAPDLILLDLNFNRQKKQGLDFLREYAVMYPQDNPATKVIILTAYSQYRDGLALKKDYSSMEVLEKPFSVEQLMYPSSVLIETERIPGRRVMSNHSA